MPDSNPLLQVPPMTREEVGLVNDLLHEAAQSRETPMNMYADCMVLRSKLRAALEGEAATAIDLWRCPIHGVMEPALQYSDWPDDAGEVCPVITDLQYEEYCGKSLEQLLLRAATPPAPPVEAGLTDARETLRQIYLVIDAALHPEPAQEPGTYLPKIRELIYEFTQRLAPPVVREDPGA